MICFSSGKRLATNQQQKKKNPSWARQLKGRFIWWRRRRWKPIVFIDWYEWYWSESSYFLSTGLSFGWLTKSSPGFSLFFDCQTAGWLVMWQSVVGSSVLLPDKRVRLSHTPTANLHCHLAVCFLSARSQRTMPGHRPTYRPHHLFLQSLTLHEATAHFCDTSLLQCKSIHWLILVNIRARKSTMQSACS